VLNRIVLIGRLTKDPDLRYTASGAAICRFTLAVDRPSRKDGDKQTDFINCIAWRQLAEIVANHLTKGQLAAVDGSLEIQTYETDSGERRQAAQVVAESVRFLSPRTSKEEPSF